MILEREGSRYRLSMRVQEALELQRDLAKAIGVALRDRQPATESMSIVDSTEYPARKFSYPSVLLVTVDGRVQSPAQA